MSRNKHVAKEFTDTREAWCIQMAQFLSQELAAYDEPITMQGDRTIKISIAPISRPNTLGVCYASSNSPEKNVNHIVISPLQAEPIELAHTLLHEMLHAFDDCHSRHRSRWKRWADQFGMQPTNHERNTKCQVLLERAVAHVGIPVQHAGQVMVKNTKAPSLLKLVCPACNQYAYISAKVAKTTGFGLICAKDNMTLQVIS